MLSTERSIDPSTSSLNQIDAKSDERNIAQSIGSQKLDAKDFLVSPPTPNFSLRDYVYKSRSNGICACWPFKPKFLQLCLNNGVKELLPPFETSHKIKKHLISVTSQQPDPSIIDVLNDKELNSDKTIHKVAENLPLVAIKDRRKRNKGVRKVKSSCDLPEKCKLVVKLSSSVPGTSRADGLASNSCAAIDQMASKICPVCKTFSSSSNTTLNAHIDQCLSIGSSSRQFELDVLRPKIKPPKKKLMVEIYATALHYTLEDLDRRNGTNWAASAVAAEPIEMLSEHMKSNSKEPEKSKEVMVDSRGIDRDGAVYVDSNGIKICILSKLNDSLASPSVVSTEIKKKDKIQPEKRKAVGSENMEKKKLKLDKKFKKLKTLKTQVQQLPIDGAASGMGNENEASPHLHQLLVKSKEPVTLNGIASPLGNWVCAKRSDIRKKRKNRNPYKITHGLASIIDDSPSTGNQISKQSNSKSTSSTVRLKLPKSLLPNKGNSTNTGFSGSPLAKPDPKSFRKQRSMLKHGKRRQVSCFSLGFLESTEMLCGETISENKRFKFTENDGLPEKFTPVQQQFKENTKFQDDTSPAEHTELDVEATASKEHLNVWVDTPNDEPINLKNPSWLQEECAVARVAVAFCDDDNIETPEDDDTNEGHDDDNVSANADSNQDDDFCDDDNIETPEDDDTNEGHDDDNVSANADSNQDDDKDADDVAVETSDETGHDTPQDDSSITSNGEDEMNLERSLANFQELSGSPSTASTMSLSTPFTIRPGSFTQPPCPDLRGQVEEMSHGVEKIMDKPCLCSCKEGLPEECKKGPIVTKERQVPPLYIGPRETGPFNAYGSFPRPDPMVNSGFEFPSQSFSTLSQSLVPPSPNPVLRLMGKNLLVVNHEEVTVDAPTPCSYSPSAFGPANCGANQSLFYQNFSLSRSQHATNLYQPFVLSERQMPVSPSPFVHNEMVVIDDPPKIDNMSLSVPVPMQLQGVSLVEPGSPVIQNLSILGASMMQSAPFFCFPQHNQAGPTRPFFYPRVGIGHITQQVGPPVSHEAGSFVPGSSAFQSHSSHVGNAVYYSHTMR